MKDNFLSRYTPRIMPPQVLEDIFVQRHGLASELVERIRASVLTPQKTHTLLIGPRGIGKSHLVSLIYNRIREMEDLDEHLLIALLSEDEWGITSFLSLLLSIFQALNKDVEALYGLPEAEAEVEGVRLLKELIDSSCCEEDPPQPPLLRGENLVKVPLIKGDLGGSPDLPSANQEDPPQPPLARGENQVKVPLIKGDLGGSPGFPGHNNNSPTLLLIVENLDELFAGLGKDGQTKFRDFLATTNCVILATSTCEFKDIQQKKSPFYGFFEIQKLAEFSAEDATQLLANIATYKGNAELATFIQTPKGRDRIKAVHALAGGNPRIYVIFSDFLASQESLDELVKTFVAMLDNLMPYYQERMKNLSLQQRKIIDILVRYRGAVQVKEIATRGLMSQQTASSQLKKLLDIDYIRVQVYGRQSFYELREPLMRLCLETKQQRGKLIKAIVDFLRRWYTKAELQQRLELLDGEVSHESALETVKSEATLETEYLQSAIEAFDHDDEKDPRVVACWEELRDCFKKKDYVSALQQADKLVEIKGQAKDWFTRGYCLARLERYEEAVDSWDKSLEIKSDQYQAWFFRGYALRILGRYEEALACCDKAIELGDQSSPVFFNRAICLLYLNRWDEGITILEDAFNRLKDEEEEEADPEDAELIIINLFKNSQDPANWTTRLTSLITLYAKYQIISALGQGLVKSIPMLMSEMVSDKAAQIWLEIWQELGSKYEQFQIPLRLLDAAVRYRQKSDPRVLLSLPLEERKLLEEVLKREST